jgi:hypothetical protein
MSNGISGIQSSDGSISVTGGGDTVDLKVVTGPSGGVQLGQDLGGTNSAPVVIGIQTVPVSSTPPAAGDVLVATAGVWTPTAIPLGISPGTGIGVSAAAGIYTVSNTGVLSVAAEDPSIVIGGTSSNPLIATGTLDVIATQHPPAIAWSNNSKKITNLANGSAPSDAAAFGQIPTSLPPNGSAGGDLSGTYPNPTVAQINGTLLGALSGATDTQYLGWQHSSSSWIPLSLPTALPPNGSAGGDLSGTYPNPTVAKINGAPLGSMAVLPTGDALTWNGSAFVPLATVQSISPDDASIVVTHSSYAASLHTGTLDVIATAQPPAANWSNNSKKITSLANGTASSDAAAFGQIPTVPSVETSNPLVIGPPAAGSTGKWSDGGHVHGMTTGLGAVLNGDTSILTTDTVLATTASLAIGYYLVIGTVTATGAVHTVSTWLESAGTATWTLVNGAISSAGTPEAAAAYVGIVFAGLIHVTKAGTFNLSASSGSTGCTAKVQAPSTTGQATGIVVLPIG